MKTPNWLTGNLLVIYDHRWLDPKLEVEKEKRKAKIPKAALLQMNRLPNSIDLRLIFV